MNWTERLFASRASSQDSTGAKIGTREWFVDTQDVSAARSLFQVEVADWFTFPGEGSFTYDRHDVRIDPSGAGCLVTAQYSTNKGNKAIILSAAPLSSIDWDDQIVQAQIPINVRGWTIQDDGAVVGFWEQTKLNANRDYPVLKFSVTVRGGTVRQFDVVAAEKGKVHIIAGEAMQLVEATVNRLDATTWKVVYRYLLDKGTFRRRTNDDFFRFVPPADRPTTDPYTGVSTADYWRLPFEQLDWLKSPDPISVEHPCYSARPVLNPSGWVGLPGAQYFDRDSNDMPRYGFVQNGGG